MPDVDQLALWHQWQDEKDDTAYDTLIDSLSPLIKYNLNKWATNPVNQVALKAHAYSLIRDNLAKYDPEKGAISTHITNSMLPLHRYVTKYQNPMSLPERLVGEFGKVKRTESGLVETLGRRPTVDEIAADSGLSADKVERIRNGMATSVPISAVLDEADEAGATWAAMNSVADRNMHFLRAELKGTERKVFDYIAREAKKRGKISAQEVADNYKIPVADVYAYRAGWTRRLNDAGIR